jgi:hypothetical protein
MFANLSLRHKSRDRSVAGPASMLDKGSYLEANPAAEALAIQTQMSPAALKARELHVNRSRRRRPR